MSATVPMLEVTGTPRERIEALGLEVADLYRALAHQPAMLEAWLDFSSSLRREPAVSRALRELMILRSAQMHDARYQWRDHVRMAAEAGVGPEQVDGLEDWASSTLFDEKTRCALAFTEEMVRGELSDATLDELVELFTPAERIELILTAGFYCMVPRVLDALRLRPSIEDIP
ncbi:MAG: carboxymuconolactone decarboxylase family protein [Acidimicrobiia bacterium]